MAEAIRVPIRRTISASLFTLAFTTLFSLKNELYCCCAIVCNSVSDTRLNCLRPVTKFCVHPAHWFQSKTRIGGTKQLNLPLIESLKPDLVIASKEENVKEQVEALKVFTKVHLTDVSNFEDALKMITINNAKILGIDDITGSIEMGKDANIIISDGDILDMRGNQVTKAFIQGRDISLDNKQKQMYERYKHKYKIN